MKEFKVLVIGGSAGSLEVILEMLAHFNPEMSLSVVIVLHRKSSSDSSLEDLLSTRTKIKIAEAESGLPILPGRIWVAPADYHLLIENNLSFTLDYSEKVNYSRPCLDITFQTAAEAFGDKLACLLLSGASADGVEGLVTARELGATIAVQDPGTAEVSFMPQQAISRLKPDHILNEDAMIEFIKAVSAPRG